MKTKKKKGKVKKENERRVRMRRGICLLKTSRERAR